MDNKYYATWICILCATFAPSHADFNNSCLIPKLKPPPGPQTFDCPKWVIETTDEIWNLRPNVNASIEKYFTVDFASHNSWGIVYKGLDQLKEAVAEKINAFPDIKIHITDCFCVGNDIDGYKTTMPDILTGTHTGFSKKYGPPTGKTAIYAGIANTFVKNVGGQWKYVAEWVMHDEWALMAQLGIDINKVPHPTHSQERIHDCQPLKPTWP